jgi:hypothetical protein
MQNKIAVYATLCILYETVMQKVVSLLQVRHLPGAACTAMAWSGSNTGQPTLQQGLH